MPPVAASFVACLALLLYFVLSANAVRARARYGVKAPATTGHLEFEKRFRVQQNTLEQIVVFVPALLFFGAFVDSRIGAAIGLVWIAGRAHYAWSYVRDPEKRGPGMVATLLSTAVLLVGALVGIGLVGLRWM
ncbi:MAG: MAPEG family protein [Alphaproteobacteria bacterium]